MTHNSSSVIKLKNAAIELLELLPCEKITVAAVLERSGVARRTFYKYFENIGSLWHSLSHDTVISIEALTGSLILTPANDHTRSQKSNIRRMAGLSCTEISKYMADYLVKNSLLILCLAKQDPYFLEKWRRQVNAMLAETLIQSGYSDERALRIGSFLSKALVDGCLLNLRLGDRQGIIRDYMGIYDILYILCEHQKELRSQATQQLQIL